MGCQGSKNAVLPASSPVVSSAATTPSSETAATTASTPVTKSQKTATGEGTPPTGTAVSVATKGNPRSALKEASKSDSDNPQGVAAGSVASSSTPVAGTNATTSPQEVVNDFPPSSSESQGSQQISSTGSMNPSADFNETAATISQIPPVLVTTPTGSSSSLILKARPSSGSSSPAGGSFNGTAEEKGDVDKGDVDNDGSSSADGESGAPEEEKEERREGGEQS